MRRVTSLFLLGFLMGCGEARQETPEAKVAPLRRRAVGERRFFLQGSHLALGDVKGARWSADQFYQRFKALIEQKRRGSARRLVERFPDTSLEVLESKAPVLANAEALQWLAMYHDQRCLAKTGRGWYAHLSSRRARADAYKIWDAKVSAIIEASRSGKFNEALASSLEDWPEPEPSTLLRLRAYRLQGIGCLLDEKYERARDQFSKAIEQARVGHPSRLPELWLLQSDCLRRLESSEKSFQAWDEAVLAGARLVRHEKAFMDPNFWEKVAYLRPHSRALPAKVEDCFGKGGESLWCKIAEWRMQRREARAGLLAAKRAESLVRAVADKARFKLLQARALLSLKQPGPATTLLVELIKGSSQKSAARALLGSLEVQQKELLMGLRFLRDAVESKDSWPRKAHAQADLGLAYLLMGEEDKGIHWIHEAQRGFTRDRDLEALTRSLRNEIHYLRFKEREDAVQVLEGRLLSLERS